MSAIRLHIQSLLPLMASFPIGPCGVTASINPAFIPTNSFHPRCHYLRPNSSGTAPGRPPFLSSTDGRTNIQSRTTDRHPPSLPFHTAISPSRLSTRAGRMTRCHSSPFSELDTALEWLARERSSREKSNHSSLPGRDGGDNVTGSRSGDANGDGGAKRNEIQWFSPTEFQKDEGDDDERRLEWETMPLYPLGEVHVPFSGENHTLINTEPRNVKMARVSAEEFLWAESLCLTFLSKMWLFCHRNHCQQWQRSLYSRSLFENLLTAGHRRWEMERQPLLRRPPSQGHQSNRIRWNHHATHSRR